MTQERLMLSHERALIALIQENRDDLCKSWMKIVGNTPSTRSYKDFDQEVVYQRVDRCFEHLARWLDEDFSKADIATHYTAEGAKRRREAFKLSEVIRAFLVARRILWYKVQESGLVDPAMTADMALLLNNRVLMFFDRALFYMSIGYEKGEKRPDSPTKQWTEAIDRV